MADTIVMETIDGSVLAQRRRQASSDGEWTFGPMRAVLSRVPRGTDVAALFADAAGLPRSARVTALQPDCLVRVRNADDSAIVWPAGVVGRLPSTFQSYGTLQAGGGRNLGLELGLYVDADGWYHAPAVCKHLTGGAAPAWGLHQVARDPEGGPIVDTVALSLPHDVPAHLRRLAELRCAHRNVVRILGVAPDRGDVYMPWYAGGTLAAAAPAPYARFGAAGLRDILADAVAGLRYLHVERGLLHGDVKPDNILVDCPPHGRARGVVGDVDDAVGRRACAEQAPRGAAVVGTPGYGAWFPPCDPRRDLFALAMVAAETLSEVPWWSHFGQWVEDHRGNAFRAWAGRTTLRKPSVEHHVLPAYGYLVQADGTVFWDHRPYAAYLATLDQRTGGGRLSAGLWDLLRPAADPRDTTGGPWSAPDAHATLRAALT